MTDFREAMQAAGLNPPEYIEPGRFHRFPGIGKSSGTAGWCKMFDDGQGGTYGDYSTGFAESWQVAREQPLTKEERAAFRRQVEESRRHAEEQRCQEQQKAAAKAKAILSGAVGDPTGHPYATTKKVFFGELVKRGTWEQRDWHDALLAPMFGECGQIDSVQAINIDGTKDFLIGGKKKGCFYPLGKFRGVAGRVLIGEGLATVAAVVAATKLPGVVAFDAGNLLHVAEVVRRLAPDAGIVLLADDDQKDGTDKNPGIESATRAALAIGGLVALPAMGKKADFWDLWHEQGPDAVCHAIDAAAPVEDQQDGQQDVPELIDPEILVQQLAKLSPIEYERQRVATAEILSLRTTVLDKLVKVARKGEDENDLPFDEPDPWHEPVNPDQLLTDIADTIQRFIVCSKEVAHTVALWSAMTWFMDVVQVAPLAVITAPEKRCGKSQLLFLLGRLSARSITASSISPAALYRAIDMWGPTLLIDEADAFMKDNEELRGIINSGHTRDSAYVIRTVGDNHVPTKFNTWGAKAIAGIGHIADTLMDRAVILELRRKLPHESVDRLRYAESDLFPTLRAKLARFANDYSCQVRQARPPLPVSLNDRAQDNWEPLLAIAMVAGGHWLEIGTKAALKLSGTENAAQTIGTELLADIQEIFEARGTDRISTADLIKALCEDDEKVWSTYNRGNPIKPRQLANKLKGYGITSGNIRIGNAIPKGFKLEQFNEAFSRYIPQAPPEISATPLQSRNFGILNPLLQTLQETPNPLHATPPESKNVADYPPRSGCVAEDKQRNLLFNRTCSGVADRTPLKGSETTEVEL